jgi:hypothetical protein
MARGQRDPKRERFKAVSEPLPLQCVGTDLELAGTKNLLVLGFTDHPIYSREPLGRGSRNAHVNCAPNHFRRGGVARMIEMVRGIGRRQGRPRRRRPRHSRDGRQTRGQPVAAYR